MTNTRMTDPEILELRYPVLLERFEIRRGSGGKGRHKAGDGVIRELRFLETMDCAILSGYRNVRPVGIDNGERGVWGGKTETDRRWDRWPHLRPAPVERRPPPIRHGTYAGHRAHQRQGVPMCEPCAKAAAEYQQRRQQARTARRQAGRALRSVS